MSLMAQDLQAITKRILDFRNQRNWKQFHNAKDMAISLTLESSELLELFQWKNEHEVKDYLLNNKEKISDELADVLYWVLLMANDLDIDLNESLNEKMDKNEAKYPVEKSKNNHKKYTEL
jgi:NTP pyrophosphatase (non-canonical NTP hydrolase)